MTTTKTIAGMLIGYADENTLKHVLRHNMQKVWMDERNKTVEQKLTYFKASFLVRKFIPTLESRHVRKHKDLYYVSPRVKSLVYDYFCRMAREQFIVWSIKHLNHEKALAA